MSKLFDIADVAYLLKPVIPLKWICAVAGLKARAEYLVCGRERSVVRANLAETFGKDKTKSEIDSMTSRFFEYRQLRGVLLNLFPKLKPREVERLFPMEGLEHLDRALEQKKGVILMGSHINSSMTLITKDILRRKGYDIRVAIPTETLPYGPTLLRRMIDRFSLNGRGTGQEGMFFAQFNIRPIVRSLAENAVVILMGDGWHSAGFVKAEFLGRRVSFTTGAMSIARLTRSPVVPVFATGAPPDGLEIRIEEPIPLEKTGDPRRDLEAMVQKYAQRLEYHLRRNIPCWEHWLQEDTLDTMAGLLEKSIGDRYHV